MSYQVVALVLTSSSEERQVLRPHVILDTMVLYIFLLGICRRTSIILRADELDSFYCMLSSICN